MVISGVPDTELEWSHWNLGDSRDAQGLRIIPSGISVYREYGSNVAMRQILQELSIELQELLGQSGLLRRGNQT